MFGEEIVESLSAHKLSPDKKRAAEACVQKDLTDLIGATRMRTEKESCDTKTYSDGAGSEMKSVVDLTFGSFCQGAETLSDIQTALEQAMSERHSKYITFVSIQWKSIPSRRFVWHIRLTFRSATFDEMLRRSSPVGRGGKTNDDDGDASESEPATPSAPPNSFSRFSESSGATIDTEQMNLRRRRDRLEQNLKEAAVEAENSIIGAYVATAIRDKEEPTATSVQIVKPLKKMVVVPKKKPNSVSNAPRAAIAKKASPKQIPHQPPPAKAGGSVLKYVKSLILGDETGRFVADYGFRPQLFQRAET